MTSSPDTGKMRITGTKRTASIHPLVTISFLGILVAASAGFLFGPGLGPKGAVPAAHNSASSGTSLANSAPTGVSGPINSEWWNTASGCRDSAALVTGFDPITGAACHNVSP